MEATQAFCKLHHQPCAVGYAYFTDEAMGREMSPSDVPMTI